MIVPSYHYMIGPLSALLALGVIVLICRWVFSTTHRDDRTARLAAAQARGDFGLLVPVATDVATDQAEQVRTRLREAGVRATVAGGELAGTSTVLVFRADAERARALVD